VDKTESLANSIYKDISSLQEHYKSVLQSSEKNNEVFSFVRTVFNDSSEKERKLFLDFIKIIVSDSASTILGGLDGTGGNILNSCDKIEIFCDGDKIEPWINELFLEMVEKSYNFQNQD